LTSPRVGGAPQGQPFDRCDNPLAKDAGMVRNPDGSLSIPHTVSRLRNITGSSRTDALSKIPECWVVDLEPNCLHALAFAGKSEV